jgi:hypothetical protein
MNYIQEFNLIHKTLLVNEHTSAEGKDITMSVENFQQYLWRAEDDIVLKVLGR